VTFTSLAGNHLNSAVHVLDSYNCPSQLWIMLKCVCWSTYTAGLVVSSPFKRSRSLPFPDLATTRGANRPHQTKQGWLCILKMSWPGKSPVWSSTRP